MAKKRRQPLTKQRLLTAAMELADEKGAENLSMRNVAERLGVQAMSLYNHVKNKNEVLDGLVELVMEQIEPPSTESPWREAMRERAHAAHAVLLKHPWAASLVESRIEPGPVRLRLHDAVLGSLRQAGFSVEQAYFAFLTLDSFIYGFTLQEVNWPFEPSERPAVMESLTPQIPSDTYVHIAEVMGHISKRPLAKKREDAYLAEFSFGLELILDGLERTLCN